MDININGKKFSVTPKQSVLDNQKGQPYNDSTDPAIVRDESKCIGCGICQKVCSEYNNLLIPEETKVGDNVYFRPDGFREVGKSKCTRCGQCIMFCPTGTLAEKENIEDVKRDLLDPDKIVIAQVAPSIRVSLSESFGQDSGLNMEGELVGALEQLGFDYVFDVNLGADFTTYEEAYDLKERVENNKLPLFTSCCPARVKYIEDFHPHLIPFITPVRSPQLCLAAIIKTYFAKKNNIDPKKISVVSIMPCVAKKFESRRKGEDKSGSWDVDWVLTTREIIKMIKEAGIDLTKIAKKEFDAPLGEYSGAGAIYGASGGVMESAIRTFVDIYGGKTEKVDYKEIRGSDGIKKMVLTIGGKDIKIAVATGLANAEKIFKEIKNGEIYHYVEVMACPGGCVGGGGQPKPVDQSIIDKRREALYKIDLNKKVRKAHENPTLLKIYKEFFGCAGSDTAKKYLHTHYDPGQVKVCQ